MSKPMEYDSNSTSFSDTDSDGFEDEFVMEHLLSMDRQDLQKSRHRGSVGGRIVIRRDIAKGGERLFEDYFSRNPVYDEKLFRRRFRMQRSLFLRILSTLKQQPGTFFQQSKDAIGRNGLTPIQKMTAALRQLAYGVSADATDEYIRIGESTAMVCLKSFCREVIAVFGDEYLRKPTAQDCDFIMKQNADRGFPGMLGSIDCYSWKWDKCPKAWQGQYRGIKGTSIVLEGI